MLRNNKAFCCAVACNEFRHRLMDITMRSLPFVCDVVILLVVCQPFATSHGIITLGFNERFRFVGRRSARSRLNCEAANAFTTTKAFRDLVVCNDFRHRLTEITVSSLLFVCGVVNLLFVCQTLKEPMPCFNARFRFAD